MSLKKALPESSRILSYAPFLPCKDAEAGIWGRERFLELLLGEVRRLRDDEKGYGPGGRDLSVMWTFRRQWRRPLNGCTKQRPAHTEDADRAEPEDQMERRKRCHIYIQTCP